MELRDANVCNQRMRNEALKVVQTTKKYLTAQKCANDVLKSRMDSCSERRHVLGTESRELDNQLREVTRMNEYLLCELQNSRHDDYDLEPRSFSPQPWGYSHVERDTSPEYFAESGFQVSFQTRAIEKSSYSHSELFLGPLIFTHISAWGWTLHGAIRQAYRTLKFLCKIKILFFRACSRLLQT